MLFFVEVGLVEGFDVVILNRFTVKKAFDDTAFEKVLINDFFDIFRMNAGIEASFRVNDHDRAECTQAEASGLNDLDFLFQPNRFDFFFELGYDLL